MALRRIFKVSRKTFINPAGWIDFESLKAQNRTMWDVLKSIFTVPKPEREETFEAAIKRLDLHKKDLDSAVRNYHYYAILFLLLAFFAIFYSFFLLFGYSSFAGWILGMMSAFLFASQAFRYDFWAYQIKHRRLGVTFKEWWHSFLGKKGSEK